MNDNGNEIDASKLLKKDNDSAVNVLLSAFSEDVAVIFGKSTIAKEMRDVLINMYKCNTQIKRIKLTGLEKIWIV